ncbi:hypothetical protein [Desulfuromonas thiophila]|uniref:Uncharacterized protein n=1 Tax=Desulfuromonas thiophila TaxID=57664 RepID=A0A1G7B3X6_9BACT|nr:hypothetical protein [Desulfuromonas thiophila]SDE20996.1 hypothetical protein SAMN05661003_10522 [Desulfuromonas thiophila]
MKALCEQFKIVEAIAPQAGGSAVDGDYVSLKHCTRAIVAVSLTQGNAATVALTLEKATAVDGTGSTAITTAAKLWANEDTAAGDTLTRQTDAVAFTTSAAVKNKQVIFEIDPVTLGDGYDCICVKAGASNAANIVQATYLLEGRYQQAAPPSATVD